MNSIPESGEERRARTIVIAANFTAEPISESLRFWLDRLGYSDEIVVAPYDQIFQQLTSPQSLLADNHDGLNVLLISSSDWAGSSPDQALEPKTSAQGQIAEPNRNAIARNLHDFAVAVRGVAEHSSVPWLVCFCPADDSADLNEIEERTARTLEQSPNVYAVTSAQLRALYPVDVVHDPLAAEAGRVPYTREFFAALGTLVARRYYRLQAPELKAIAVDCDGTLWRGVCGEEGPLGVTVENGHRALQRFLLEQREAGTLICLCSKNNENDVWSVFAQNPGMLLKREHLAAARLNWQPKSENLRALASELQFGLETVVLLDDSPQECAEVAWRCPEVLALQVPAEPEIPDFCAHIWALDHLKATAEDRIRARFLEQDAQREQIRHAAMSFEDFLAHLDLRIAFSAISPEDRARVFQLAQRTNQFNCTGEHASRTEIERLGSAGYSQCLVVRVQDRFGDYGLVGAAIFHFASGALEVENVMLSCRALGRRVEHAIAAQLATLALSAGASQLTFHYVPTARNGPARDFLASLGATVEEPEAAELAFNCRQVLAFTTPMLSARTS